jgi:diguanylate cyclase (GGDEF)-like protein
VPVMTRAVAVLTVAIALIVVLVTTAFRVFHDIDAHNAGLAAAVGRHDAERDVLSGLIDQETGMRAYVATADPAFLDAVERGRVEVRHGVEVLRGQPGEPPGLLEDAAEIARFVATEIELGRTGRRAEASRALARGRAYLDAFRLIDADAQRASRADVVQAEGEVSLAVRRAEITLIVAGPVLLLLALSLYGLLQTGARIEDVAFRDPLTRLPNRRAFDLRLRRTQTAAERAGRGFAVLFLDLDGFKAINDLHGHATGDRVLETVAARLQATMRDGDIVARLGGDEFAVLLHAVDEEAPALTIAMRVRATVTAPLNVGGRLEVGCSIGVAVFPVDAPDADDLLRRADRAMYDAKQSGAGIVAASWRVA